jgi:tRNA pseudouridine55 synthase
MDGFILVHKPQDFTSHDIVLFVRKILGVKKVGHFGTLDPMATGLMLVAVGKATRFFPFFLNADKTYQGKIRLGFSTNTYDAYGKQTSEEDNNYPNKQTLLKNMKQFEGTIDQVCPPFSAKKHMGTPLYELARQGQKIELKTKKVCIHYFRLLKYASPFVHFTVKCSSGTYVRSLVHDLGQKLGCRAHLVQLIRTNIGNFHQNESHSLEDIEIFFRKGMKDKFLIPLASILPEYPSIFVEENMSSMIARGRDILDISALKVVPGDTGRSQTGVIQENIYRIFDKKGELIAFAKKNLSQESLHPFLVINPADNNL